MSAPVEILAVHNDEGGTDVRIYVGGILREQYDVHPEQGNWRHGLPNHDRLTERRA